MRARMLIVVVAVVAALCLLGLPTFMTSGPAEAPAVSTVESHATASSHATTTSQAYARLASVERLQQLYGTWRAGFEANGGAENLVIRVGWAKGLSAEKTYAQGVARLDLYTGAVRLDVAGLDDGLWEAWLVDNVPGAARSTLPEAGDLTHSLGRFDSAGGRGHLESTLADDVGSGFHIDRVIVTRAGDRPEERPVLFGAPTLFERLYMRSDVIEAAPELPLLAGNPLFGPQTAFAVDTPFNSLDPLVAQGADLFFNETFAGNGRTCASCHPAENNFTIDPRFIAQLSDDDPLFVSEQVPALAELENPVLLRELGLIRVNADGFDQPAVQRAVPHLLGLSRYLEPGNQAVPPLQRTGWSGDGAPGSGTLREFSLGAVTQHMTLTLARTPGIDFRVPTDQELDALEAFMLLLGRQDFPDISEITLLGPVPDAGRELFQVFAVDAALCTFCHQEGGANGPTEGLNFNFDIGISSLDFHPAEAIQPGSLPPDGGFGREPLTDPDTGEFLGFGTFNVEENVNERRFNSFPAIEAVDTGPFFHDHAVQTIEEAVDFYNSEEFLTAPSALPIKMSTTEVEAIAAFLRVMNTLENIRASNLVARAAIDEVDRDVSKRLAELAAFDTQDGYQVLEERFLHPDAIAKLKQAFAKELLASKANGAPVRNALLQSAIDLKQEAKDLLVVE